MRVTAEQKNDFTVGSIPRAILGMSVPITLAQLVNVLYNVVDRIYIGHIPEVGATAFTGVGLCLPITTVIIAFARLCGMGGAPLCAIERGRGNHEKAEQIMGNAFCLLLILAVVLTVLGLVFMRAVLFAFGASAETYPYASDYGLIYILGNLFVLISLGMNGFINSQGFAKIGMMTVALGAAVNIILDPVFIFDFGLGLGVRGAALATVISQACSAVWVLRFLTGKRAILKLRLGNLRLKLGIVKRILTLGFAGFNMLITNALVQIMGNRLLFNLGGDLYVGIMTAINAVREVFMMPVQGLTNGAEPVIGYNFGAKRYGRVREGIRFMSMAAIGYGLFSWGLAIAFPGVMMRVFTSDAALIGAGKAAFRAYYAGYFLMALQFAGQSVFVALGESKKAIFFSVLRKVAIVAPLMLILPHVGNLGVYGVLLAEPVSNLFGGVACFATMVVTVLIPLKNLPDGEECGACGRLGTHSRG